MHRTQCAQVKLFQKCPWCVLIGMRDVNRLNTVVTIKKSGMLRLHFVEQITANNVE